MVSPFHYWDDHKCTDQSHFYSEILQNKLPVFHWFFQKCLLLIASFILSKKILALRVPYKTIFLNVVCVIPFSFFTYLAGQLSNNNFITLVLSTFFCGLYFLFYQLFIIKDVFLMEMLNPFLLKFKKKVVFSK